MVEKKIMKKEKEIMEKMLGEGYTKTAIAKTLKISRMSVYRTIKKYSLRKKQGWLNKFFRR